MRSSFPDPRQAPADAPLAMGGDLSPERLLDAYAHGIFPWYNEETPILWWSPDPRFVLPLEEFRVRRSLAKVLCKAPWTFTMDRACEQVMRGCATQARPNQDGTWILQEMITAYGRLHDLGFAHSVECWEGERLVGGLYGVSLGRLFFGESMFHWVPDASKTAFVHFVQQLIAWDFALID